MVKTKEFLNIFQANNEQYVFNQEQEVLLRDLIAQLKKHLSSCQIEETCQKEFECDCDDCQKLIKECKCSKCSEKQAELLK